MAALSRTEGIPLYVKIREALRQEILQGELKRGEKILSEGELADRYGVSRMTVRQGITDLIEEGLLYRRHGVGTFVAFPHVERDHSRLTNFFETSKLKGIDAHAKVLSIDVLPARSRVAKALDLKEGDLVIRVVTLRFHEDVPVTVHDAFIPHNLFSALLKEDLSEDLESVHIWSFYERCGYKVKRAIQRLEAREAEKEMAQLMGILEGAPVLYKERTLYAEDGTPIEFTHCYNRGDLYSLTVTLDR